MNQSLRRALVVATATAAVLAPTAAFAQTYTHADGKGDVQSIDLDSGAQAPAPTVAEGDAVSSTVAHNARKVVVTMHFAQLSPTTDLTEQVVSIKTNRGKVRDLVIVAGPGHWGGKVVQQTGQGKKWRCSTRHSIDYTHDTITATVPRRCLGNPRSVQVALGTVTSQSQKFYVDDAQSATVGQDLVYGPKVFRG